MQRTSGKKSKNGVTPQSDNVVTPKPPKADRRHRWQYRFWLDAHNPTDYKVAEIIGHFKRQRSFQQALRDGLRLIFDLRAGRIDVLLELFPNIRQQLAERESASDQFNALMHEITELRRQVTATTPLLAAHTGEKSPRDVMEIPRAVVLENAPDPHKVNTNFLKSLASYMDDDD